MGIVRHEVVGGTVEPSSVVLLASLNDTLVDDSNSGHTLTLNDGAQFITPGHTSPLSYGKVLDPNGGQIEIADSADWWMMEDATTRIPWTAECWIRNHGDSNEYGHIMGQWDSSTGQKCWALVLDRRTTINSWKVLTSVDGTTSIERISGWNGAYNLWAHLAVCYDMGAIRLFENGTYRGGAVVSDNLFDSNAPFTIGNQLVYNGEVASEISEVRVTKGIARYTEAFTRPTEPFPRS